MVACQYFRNICFYIYNVPVCTKLLVQIPTCSLKQRQLGKRFLLLWKCPKLPNHPTMEHFELIVLYILNINMVIHKYFYIFVLPFLV